MQKGTQSVMVRSKNGSPLLPISRAMPTDNIVSPGASNELPCTRTKTFIRSAELTCAHSGSAGSAYQDLPQPAAEAAHHRPHAVTGAGPQRLLFARQPQRQLRLLHERHRQQPRPLHRPHRQLPRRRPRQHHRRHRRRQRRRLLQHFQFLRRARHHLHHDDARQRCPHPSHPDAANPSVADNFTFSIALNSTSGGLMVETDGSSTMSGNFRLQNITNTFATSYVFDFSGLDLGKQTRRLLHRPIHHQRRRAASPAASWISTTALRLPARSPLPPAPSRWMPPTSATSAAAPST